MTARTAILCVVLAAASTTAPPVASTAASPGASPGAVPGPGDPWEARDRLTPGGAAPAHPGWRLAAAATSWEALDGDLRTTLRLAREPARGLGVALGWRRYWLHEGPGADDLEMLAVLRAPVLRVAAGAGVLRRGGRRVTRWVIEGSAQAFGPLVAGGRVALHPAEESWAPEVTAGLYAARDPWWGGVELGPRPGDFALSVGLRVRRDLAWTTTWAGDHPELGVAWGLGGPELRARRAAHPLLGDVQTLALVAGGLRP